LSLTFSTTTSEIILYDNTLPSAATTYEGPLGVGLNVFTLGDLTTYSAEFDDLRIYGASAACSTCGVAASDMPLLIGAIYNSGAGTAVNTLFVNP
jgi:hypothetical protein